MPVFMPVGTQATVKSLDPRDLRDINASIILGNTYHLHLRPGEDVIANFGGLHHFMGWDGPILTDSGGFQIFSLGQKNSNRTIEQSNNINIQGKLVAIDDDGVTFRSHIDGSEHRFTPESAIEMQYKLGADIIMAFDECTPDRASLHYARQALERTHRWAERCLQTHQQYSNRAIEQSDYKKFLFGIIQGGSHRTLREESAQYISALDFDGIAIGGESIGYNMEATKDILESIMPIIPENKPHYTMGVGFSPLDIFDVVERGIDMFDCVAPTRMARNGTLYVRESMSFHGHDRGIQTPMELIVDSRSRSGMTTKKYRINITNASFKEDKRPIDPHCDCSTCAQFSRAYLHHLFNANELLAHRLATIHNLRFFLKLMEDIREAIQADRLLQLKKQWI